MPEPIKPSFSRYIGVDYAGAETPDSSQKGLRVYVARSESLPVEVAPPPSPRKYWARRGLAAWLAERLSEDAPTIVGIDHGFSFLALRRLGNPGGEIRAGGSLPVALEQKLPTGRA